MDLAALRKLLTPAIWRLAGHPHRELPALCEQFALPAPPPPESGSKRERIASSLDGLLDSQLPEVARRFLAEGRLEAATRNSVEDLLWSETNWPKIPTRCRREIAGGRAGDLFLSAAHFDLLLTRLWDLGDDPLDFFTGPSKHSLRSEIQQHVYRNPEDWSADELFDRLGVYEASGRRFALFLEGLASSNVRPDEPSQRNFVAAIAPVLKQFNLELRETGDEGGYPVFTLAVLSEGVAARPKNIVFASTEKPDLRLSNAITNEVEVLSNREKVLVYDEPIGVRGLHWRELQAWWQAREGIDDPIEAKKTLYRRLLNCLPKDSPPQQFLFETFHRGFGPRVPGLPALLPEVWFHWDPMSSKRRIADALLRSRMDFLMLLPGGAHIVIEVDGKRHYTNESGRPDPVKYAAMVAADRDLKLDGYEVFRFGAVELMGAKDEVVLDFFQRMFRRFGVATAS